MKFRKFVDYLEKLEGVSGRLAMTDILVELLKKLTESDVDKGVYLMLGKMAPKFRKIEFNMAEKMVMRSIALVLGSKTEKVRQDYKRTGDLGLTWASLRKKWEGGSKKKEVEILSVTEAYKELKKIALDEGQGSQERKVEALAYLLGRIGVRQGKFVVRIVLSKLRLGFSDKTVLDAVSVMERGDKSERRKLDQAYQILPDVGKLIVEVKKYGLSKAVAKIKPEIGVPVWSELCQRLNTSEEIIKKMGEVAVEPKFDGTRVQIHYKKGEGVRTFTRNLDENSDMFPELSGIEKSLNAKSVILDAEAVGVDKKTGKILPFQMTITRKRKHEIGKAAQAVPLVFYVFDILYQDGVSLIEKNYGERREILNRVVKGGKILIVDEYVRTDKVSRVHQLHEEFLKQGLEGAVIKKWDGKYLPGRQGWNWVKIKEGEGKSGKLSDTLDLVVMGFYRGRGKRSSFGVGAFLVGLKGGAEMKIVTIAKIGTGLTDEQFRELKRRLDKLVSKDRPKQYGKVDKSLIPDVWVDPNLIVEIAADEITKSPVHSSGVALRFPRLVKFRDDKDLQGVTTLDEIEEMKTG